jgi:hypothetical protein
MSSEEILCLRPVRNWKKAAALQIINLVFPAVIRSKPEYALFLTAKAIKITIRDGLSPLSAVLFSMFSMILLNPVGAFEEGLRCEEIGFQIYEKFQAYYLRSRMMAIRYSYAKPWILPMSACLPNLLIGTSAGMMTGDFELAFINAFVYCIDGLLSGIPLRQHLEKMMKVKLQFSNLGQETVMFYLRSSIQLAQNLLGMAKDFKVLSGKEFDAQESLKTFVATNNAAGVCYTLLPQLFLAVFSSDYPQAVAVAIKLQRANNDNFTAFDIQYIPFLVGLSEIIMARRTKNRGHLRAANKALKRLETLTKYAQTDLWLNKIYLIKAERDALQGLHEEAVRKFFLSAEQASNHGLIHEKALAMERLGIFLLESNQVDKALDCLSNARDLYDEWGCVVKSSMMMELISGSSGNSL